MYKTFNTTKFSSSVDVYNNLNNLIKTYEASDQSIFKDFAEYLKKIQTDIIQSFVVVEVFRRTKGE